MNAAREPVSATRRAMFAGGAALAAIAVLPVTAKAGTGGLHDELDRLNAFTQRLNAGSSANPTPEHVWDQWDADCTRVYRAIEATPPTADNLRLKAKAVYNILEGDLSELNEQNTTVERLLVQIIAALAVQ